MQSADFHPPPPPNNAFLTIKTKISPHQQKYPKMVKAYPNLEFSFFFWGGGV